MANTEMTTSMNAPLARPATFHTHAVRDTLSLGSEPQFFVKYSLERPHDTNLKKRIEAWRGIRGSYRFLASHRPYTYIHRPYFGHALDRALKLRVKQIRKLHPRNNTDTDTDVNPDTTYWHNLADQLRRVRDTSLPAFMKTWIDVAQDRALWKQIVYHSF